jgi:hypothetical protein
MVFSNRQAAMLLAGALFAAVTACSGNSTVTPGVNAAAGMSTDGVTPDDTTSILKKLTKTVIIGTTTDPTNGDQGGHGIAVVKSTYGLKKGQIIVCNYANAGGAAGQGTTLDVFNSTSNSKPTTFAQSSKIEGCAGDALSSDNSVYASGFTSKEIQAFTDGGKAAKTYTGFKNPFAVLDASNPSLYSAEYVFASDVGTGGVTSFSINYYGNPKPTEVASGFGINKKTGWSALGPSGLAYNAKKDTLYIADGVDSTVVAFSHASELLVKDEIVVQKGGKTFKCKFPKTTCGTLVKAGSPLSSPVAMTILPNGNLIVANTGGKSPNTLVEMTPTGQILDTKVVDTSTTAGIFALQAIGTSDTNTALYLTDTNANNLQELEQ